MTAAAPDANVVLAVLRERGWTLATAESLTGGALCATLVAAPGASDVVMGSVVAYNMAVKENLLGVPPELLAEAGPVSPQVAREMAAGARAALGADVGVSTTGVAGPESHGGLPPGTVIVAVALAEQVLDQRFEFEGGRDEVTAQAVEAALELLATVVSAAPHDYP